MAKPQISARRDIREIPLAQILSDKNFNVRHETHFSECDDADGMPDDPEGKGTAQGIVSLADSILDRGQETPVLVRQNPDARTAKKTPYHLVAGHRRFAAMHLIVRRCVATRTPHLGQWPGWHAKDNAVIWAEVKALSDFDALMLNLAENTARDDLTAADTAFGIYRLVQAYQIEQRTLQGARAAIARATCKSERYVGRLVGIMEKTEPQILAHWRISRKPLGVVAMEQIAGVPREGQRGAYDRACAGGPLPADDLLRAARPKADPAEKVRSRIREGARFLGGLARGSYVDATGCGDFSARELLGLLGDVPAESISLEGAAAFAEIAREAFNQGAGYTMAS